MAIKKYENSYNLFGATLENNAFNADGTTTPANYRVASDFMADMLSAGEYTINATGSDGGVVVYVYDSTQTIINDLCYKSWQNLPFTFSLDQSAYVRFGFRHADNSTILPSSVTNVMLNLGSSALPYEPYGKAWHTVPYRKYGTETETLTTLPKTIIGDGQNVAAYTIKGNMTNTAACGDKTANLYFKKVANASLDGAGSIISNTSFDCYVAQVEANKQYIGTGYVYAFFANNPSIGSASYNGQRVVASVTNGFTAPIDGYIAARHNTGVTDAMLAEGSTVLPYEPYGYKVALSLNNTAYLMYITEPLRKSLDGSNLYDIIESNGTLTRRVDENGDALATPTTEQITVPTLPTTGAAESFDVQTTLKPSEVELTYTGWHEHSDTKF